MRREVTRHQPHAQLHAQLRRWKTLPMAAAGLRETRLWRAPTSRSTNSHVSEKPGDLRHATGAAWQKMLRRFEQQDAQQGKPHMRWGNRSRYPYHMRSLLALASSATPTLYCFIKCVRLSGLCAMHGRCKGDVRSVEMVRTRHSHVALLRCVCTETPSCWCQSNSHITAVNASPYSFGISAFVIARAGQLSIPKK